MSRLEGHTSWVNCFALSNDSATLVSGSGDATARVWDVSNPRRSRCKHVLGPRGFDERGDEIQAGHEGWVLSVGLHGTMLATAGADTHVWLWGIRSGECLAVLEGASKGNLAVGIIHNPGTPAGDVPGLVFSGGLGKKAVPLAGASLQASLLECRGQLQLCSRV